MDVNAKMIPVETVPGMRGGKGSREGVNSSMVYLMHFKNLCKNSNVPPSSTIIILKNEKKP
jgi:acyl CoA:acetate/3-ketoacid CoA transferase beta subunit